MRLPAVLLLLLASSLCASGNGRRVLRLSGSSDKAGLRTTESSTVTNIHKTFETLEHLANVVAVHLVHVPGTDQYLLMERSTTNRPDKVSPTQFISGTYDASTGAWQYVSTVDTIFCSGHTQLADGRVLVVGGHDADPGYRAGIQGMRLFDKRTNGRTLAHIGDMRHARWYPTATLLPSGRVVIMGGVKYPASQTAVNPTYEIWDPLRTSETEELKLHDDHHEMAEEHYYPFNYVLPNGDLFSFAGRHGYIMDPERGEEGYKGAIPRRRGQYNSKYPFSGTSVMLALKPDTWDKEAEVVVFGGAAEAAVRNLDMFASKESQRLKVLLPQTPGGEYQFVGATRRPVSGNDESGWVTEQARWPRVMGDATLLPNGHVVLLNGARKGVAGDAGPGGVNRGNWPTVWAELYKPDAPEGLRWSTVGRSMIPRLYHSTAALTTNGTVLVSGCDRCHERKVESSNGVPISESKHGWGEYRMEVFYPPAWFEVAKKPTIESAPACVEFGSEFVVRFGSEAGNPSQQVTGASLVAPSSTTHSFNSNQRVVMLQHKGTQGQAARFEAPPHGNIAPSQHYMLFLLNGEVYSKATWVQVADRCPQASRTADA